jgi:ectoine hydroxylase-related dioxygenase (phytanoyl-CoA dioxygenase family)
MVGVTTAATADTDVAHSAATDGNGISRAGYAHANGATRIVPGSHRAAPGEPPFDLTDESRAVQLAGAAGDILVFDADLAHAGCLNPSGARRRSLLICYFADPLHASHLETARLRGVRMDTSERFDPVHYPLGN